MKLFISRAVLPAFSLLLATPAAAKTVDPVTNAQQLEDAIAESHRAFCAIGDRKVAIRHSDTQLNKINEKGPSTWI